MSITTQALESLNIPKHSATVFGDSRCFEGVYDSQTVTTSLVTYRKGQTPVADMVSLILRSGHVIRFTCTVADDESYFKFLGCRLLFTLCLEKTFMSCVDSESIFVTPAGDKKTSGVMEIDLDSNRVALPERKRKGIALSHPSLRCAELKDVAAWSLRGSSSLTALVKSMDLQEILWGSPDGKKSKMKQSRDVQDRLYGRTEGGLVGNEATMLTIRLRFKSSRNYSGSTAFTLDLVIMVSAWSERDSLVTVNTGILKCIIPVQAYFPQAAVFLEVFDANVWLATAISFMTVCLLVTFPDSIAAVQLMISLGLSTLTAFEVPMPRQAIRRSNSRLPMLVLAYFMLQLILLNMYKNGVTSAFTQVESSEKIRRMIDSEMELHNEKKASGAGEWLEFTHESRPYFAQTPIFIRLKFFGVLNDTRPYCDVDHSSLLRRFYLPVATFSKTVAFSSIVSAAFKNPLLPPKSLSTLQKYGLITLKSSSLSRRDFVDQVLEAGKSLNDLKVIESHIDSFDYHKELLKNKYDAALELRDDAVLHLDDMLILFQAFAIIMIVPLIFLFVERKRNPSSLRKTRSHSGREDKEMFPDTSMPQKS